MFYEHVWALQFRIPRLQTGKNKNIRLNAAVNSKIRL